MIVRQLKNLTQEVHPESKEPLVLIKNGKEMSFTKAEAGSIARFVFSYFQYYSRPKKKKVIKSLYLLSL